MLTAVACVRGVTFFETKQAGTLCTMRTIQLTLLLLGWTSVVQGYSITSLGSHRHPATARAAAARMEQGVGEESYDEQVSLRPPAYAYCTTSRPSSISLCHRQTRLLPIPN